MSNKIFYSNAEWTKISNSQDTHLTYEQAKGVCERLLSDFGNNYECSVRGICLKTWVTDEDGNVINK